MPTICQRHHLLNLQFQHIPEGEHRRMNVHFSGFNLGRNNIHETFLKRIFSIH